MYLGLGLWVQHNNINNNNIITTLHQNYFGIQFYLFWWFIAFFTQTVGVGYRPSPNHWTFELLNCYFDWNDIAVWFSGIRRWIVDREVCSSILGLVTPWGEYWVDMPGQWTDHPLNLEMRFSVRHSQSLQSWKWWLRKKMGIHRARPDIWLVWCDGAVAIGYDFFAELTVLHKDRR